MPNQASDVPLPPLEARDVAAVVTLLTRCSDPTHDVEPLSRKRMLAEGLVRLCDANTFQWTIGYLAPATPETMPSSYLDGGWRDEQERVAAMDFMMNSPAAAPVVEPVTVAARDGQSFTVIRQQVVDEEVWRGVLPHCSKVGIGEFLMSMFPLGGGGFSCLGIHRRPGRPPFAERERAIVHLVFQNIDWIHRHGLVVEPARTALSLSPREREVFMMLLRGDSQKRIAQKLGLSHHTVGDYLKGIYRKFNVSSRAELLGRFISGGDDGAESPAALPPNDD